MNKQEPKLIKIAQYQYDLPASRIAKYPLPDRDQSKLLIYDKAEVHSDVFASLPKILPAKSLLISNNSRVLNARLIFMKPTGAKIEIFCLEPANKVDYIQALQDRGTSDWICLVGNLKKWKQGRLRKHLCIAGIHAEIHAELISRTGAHCRVRFSWEPTNINMSEILKDAGLTPIPPYLERDSETLDKTRYQTLYAKNEGSVAAPTAGLHFSERVLNNLRNKGIQMQSVSLHVTTGTFRPVKSEYLGGHSMHTEQIYVPIQTIKSLMENQSSLTLVGTTSVRTLESLYWCGVKLLSGKEQFNHLEQWDAYELPQDIPLVDALHSLIQNLEKQGIDSFSGSTSLIIAPGYQFRITQRMLTNFHMPASTLLLLIAAFTGNDWKKIYDYALHNDFRFLSYGDSSLLHVHPDCMVE